MSTVQTAKKREDCGCPHMAVSAAKTSTLKARLRLLKLRAHILTGTEWDESKHDRDNDGKFTDKGGGDDGTSKDKHSGDSSKKTKHSTPESVLKEVSDWNDVKNPNKFASILKAYKNNNEFAINYMESEYGKERMSKYRDMAERTDIDVIKELHNKKYAKELKRIRDDRGGVGIDPAKYKSKLKNPPPKVTLTKDITPRQAESVVEMWNALPADAKQRIDKLNVRYVDRAADDKNNCGGSWNDLGGSLNVTIGRGTSPSRIRAVMSHEAAHAKFDVWTAKLRRARKTGDTKTLDEVQAKFTKWAEFIDELGPVSPYAETYNRTGRKHNQGKKTIGATHLYYNENHSEVVASMYDLMYDSFTDSRGSYLSRGSTVPWEDKYMKRLAKARKKYVEIWGESDWGAGDKLTAKTNCGCPRKALSAAGLKLLGIKSRLLSASILEASMRQLYAGPFKPKPGQVADKNGVYWLTINGNPIPFREGEDFDTTVADYFKNKPDDYDPLSKENLTNLKVAEYNLLQYSKHVQKQEAESVKKSVGGMSTDNGRIRITTDDGVDPKQTAKLAEAWNKIPEEAKKRIYHLNIGRYSEGGDGFHLGEWDHQSSRLNMYANLFADQPKAVIESTLRHEVAHSQFFHKPQREQREWDSYAIELQQEYGAIDDYVQKYLTKHEKERKDLDELNKKAMKVAEVRSEADLEIQNMKYGHKSIDELSPEERKRFSELYKTYKKNRDEYRRLSALYTRRSNKNAKTVRTLAGEMHAQYVIMKEGYTNHHNGNDATFKAIDKLMNEGQLKAAFVADGAPEGLSPLKEVPLMVNHNGHRGFISVSDCVYQKIAGLNRPMTNTDIARAKKECADAEMRRVTGQPDAQVDDFKHSAVDASIKPRPPVTMSWTDYPQYTSTHEEAELDALIVDRAIEYAFKMQSDNIRPPSAYVDYDDMTPDEVLRHAVDSYSTGSWDRELAKNLLDVRAGKMTLEEAKRIALQSIEGSGGNTDGEYPWLEDPNRGGGNGAMFVACGCTKGLEKSILAAKIRMLKLRARMLTSAERIPDDEIDRWITVNGARIPVRKGESDEDASDRFTKDKDDVSDSNLPKPKPLEKADWGDTDKIGEIYNAFKFSRNAPGVSIDTISLTTSQSHTLSLIHSDKKGTLKKLRKELDVDTYNDIVKQLKHEDKVNTKLTKALDNADYVYRAMSKKEYDSFVKNKGKAKADKGAWSDEDFKYATLVPHLLDRFVENDSYVIRLDRKKLKDRVRPILYSKWPGKSENNNIYKSSTEFDHASVALQKDTDVSDAVTEIYSKG